MPKNKKTFLIIPPKRSRVRHIRIRFGVIFTLVLLTLISIAGYLIPSESINLTSEEIIRKGNLSEENNKLFIKIRRITKKLDILSKDIDTLSNSKKQVSSILDTKQSPDTIDISNKKTLFSSHNLDSILSYATKEDFFINQLIVRTNNQPDIVTSIPIVPPLKKPYTITATYGNMYDPFTELIKWHNGVDFTSKKNAEIVAPASGTVIKIENDQYWGKKVTIKHKFGFKTIYAHLNSVKVKQREHINRGDIIGTIGSTGIATGPHLHFEVVHNGKNIDPEKLFFNLASNKEFAAIDTK